MGFAAGLSQRTGVLLLHAFGGFGSCNRQTSGGKMARHLLSISDLTQEDFLDLINRSVLFGRSSNSQAREWHGRNIGIHFRKTSTRTRTSFIVATTRLGGFPVVYGPNDLQTNTGETMGDTVRVLSGYLDALVLRTAGEPEELRAMAQLDCMPIVNAMTVDEHPTQALSDLAMITRHFGQLRGLRLLYLGEGNSTAASLALAVSRIAGMELMLVTPVGYGLMPSIVAKVRAFSGRFGGIVTEEHAMSEISQAFDVVYTTRWQTTGTTKKDPLWRDHFTPFRVDESLMARVGKGEGTVFMHDLPAMRGEDCDGAVLEGPQSIAFQQAQQKLYTAMSVLEWCVSA